MIDLINDLEKQWKIYSDSSKNYDNLRRKEILKIKNTSDYIGIKNKINKISDLLISLKKELRSLTRNYDSEDLSILRGIKEAEYIKFRELNEKRYEELTDDKK
jgi:hypothetical protein